MYFLVRKDAHLIDTVPSLFIKARDFFNNVHSIPRIADSNSTDSFQKETQLGES